MNILKFQFIFVLTNMSKVLIMPEGAKCLTHYHLI